MARMYVVSMPGHEDQTLATADRVASWVCDRDQQRHKQTLLTQIQTLHPGDTAYLSGNIKVHVVGHGDEEEPPPPPPEPPETMGY